MFDSKDDEFTLAFWIHDLKPGRELYLCRPWIVDDYDVHLGVFDKHQIGEVALPHMTLFTVVAVEDDLWVTIQSDTDTLRIHKHSLWYFSLRK